MKAGNSKFKHRKGRTKVGADGVIRAVNPFLWSATSVPPPKRRSTNRARNKIARASRKKNR